MYSNRSVNQDIFSQHSQALSDWAFATLVSRTDTYGKYYLANGEVATCRAYANGQPAPLTQSVMLRHWKGEHTIGLYAQDQDDLVKCVTLDLDNHKDNHEIAKENRKAMRRMIGQLEGLGFQFIAYTSDNKGGYHLRIPFADKIPYQQARSFGLWLGQSSIEVFPKRPVIHTSKRCGNYARLILPKPGKTAYPAFWNGSDWLFTDKTEEQITFLLSVKGNDPSLIPSEALEVKEPESIREPSRGANGQVVSWQELSKVYYGDLRSLDWVKVWEDRGMLERPSGNAWEVICPWASDHTSSGNKAYIFKDDGAYPGFFCHHEHCKGRTILDALAWFSPKEINGNCEAVYGDVSYNVSIAELPFKSSLSEGEKATPTKGNEPPQADNRKRKGYRLADLMKLPPPRWLIKDHIPSDTLCELYGEPGAGKSFVAIDYSLSVASGNPYLGLYPVNKGAVLYLSGEGNSGIANRVNAWVEHYSTPCSDDCVFVPFPFDLTSENEVNAILDIIKTDLRKQPVLIVIDTLARYFGGGDENATKDMNLFVRCCDLLRQWTGATILVVHHTGKDASKKDRGSTALRGACDMMIEVQPSNNRTGCLISCSKSKNSEPFPDYLLTRKLYDVGVSEDGNELTSLVFVAMNEADTRWQLLPRQKKDLLVMLWNEFGGNAFKQAEVCKRLSMNDGTVSRDFKAMLISKVLDKTKEGFTIPNPMRATLMKKSGC